MKSQPLHEAATEGNPGARSRRGVKGISEGRNRIGLTGVATNGAGPTEAWSNVGQCGFSDFETEVQIMLCLERQPGESIIVTTPDGYEIVVMIQTIRGQDKAVIGFKASRAVHIQREELLPIAEVQRIRRGELKAGRAA